MPGDSTIKPGPGTHDITKVSYFLLLHSLVALFIGDRHVETPRFWYAKIIALAVSLLSLRRAGVVRTWNYVRSSFSAASAQHD